jgi:L-malate glycosyltransferase
VNRELFEKDAGRIQLNVDKGKANVILTVCRITAKKGLATQLGIFTRLIKIDPHNHWVIAGDGDFLPILKRMVKESGLSEKVSFLGRVSRADLPRVYKSADVFWFMSEYDEAFGLVNIEAQLCGLPVITSNRAGMAETVSDKKTGFLVNSETECLDILINETYRKIDQKDILDFAGQFDTRLSALQLMRILK